MPAPPAPPVVGPVDVGGAGRCVALCAGPVTVAVAPVIGVAVDEGDAGVEGLPVTVLLVLVTAADVALGVAVPAMFVGVAVVEVVLLVVVVG